MIKKQLSLLLILTLLCGMLPAHSRYNLPKRVSRIKLANGRSLRGYILCMTPEGVVWWKHRGLYDSSRLATSAEFFRYQDIRYISLRRGFSFVPVVTCTGVGLYMAARVLAGMGEDDEVPPIISLFAAAVIVPLFAVAGWLLSAVHWCIPRFVSAAKLPKIQSELKKSVLFQDAIPAEVEQFIQSKQRGVTSTRPDTLQP
jgi:hypothetical protein